MQIENKNSFANPLKKQETIVSKLGLILLLIAFVLNVIAILGSLEFGILLPDEGLYLHLAQRNSDNYHSLLNYDLFFKSIYAFFDVELGVIGLRWVRLILMTLVLYLVLLPIFRFYHFTVTNRLFVLLGSFAGYAIMPHALSYYNLSAFLSICYIVLAHLIFHHLNTKRIALYYLLTGVVCSCTFLVKFPLGSMLILTSVVLPFIRTNTLRHRMFLLGLLLLGFVLIQFAASAAFPYYSLLQTIKIGFGAASTSSYQYKPGTLLLSTLSLFKWSVLLGGAGFMTGWSLRALNVNKFFRFLSFALAVLAVVYFFYKHFQLEKYGLEGYAVMSVLLFLIGFLTAKSDLKSFTFKEVILFLLLLTLPVLCHLGSNLYFFRVGQHYILSWLILIVLLYLKLKHETGNQLALGLTILILSVFIPYNTYQHLILQPFGKWPLKGDFVKYSYGEHKHHLYLKKEQVLYFSKLREVLSGHQPEADSSYVIGLDKLNGDLLLSGGRCFYDPQIFDVNTMRLYHPQIKADPVYSKLKPLILARTHVEHDYLNEYYTTEIIDSIQHYHLGNVYVYKVLRIK